jgi:hypothetical protein
MARVRALVAEVVIWWGSAVAFALVESVGVCEGYVFVLVHWLIGRAGRGAEP